MKNLVIIGAGGLGREILSYAIDIEDANKTIRIKGFIDDNLKAIDQFEIEKYKVLNSIDNYQIEENDVFICAIGSPKTKLEICKKMISKGAVFINLIHPTSRIGSRTKLGKGIIIAPNVVVSVDCNISDFVTMNFMTSCGHDVTIETGVTLSSYCDVTGNSTLRVGAFLGSHSIIYPGIIVGEYSRVGMGSVVLQNVEKESIVLGNPAKRIG